MNFSLLGIHSRYLVHQSTFFNQLHRLSSFELRESSFSRSVSTILHFYGNSFSSVTSNSFSFCLATPVIVDGSSNFTIISTRQAPSSSCTFSFDVFYHITSSYMGGGMVVSGSSLNVSVHSCKFIQCYSTYRGCSGGGLSVYQAYNFVIECCLFDNCSTTISDTNSFQVNSKSSATQYCSLNRVSDVNGGLMYSQGGESCVGGVYGLSYSNHNVTSSYSSSVGFFYVEPCPSNTVIGLFCQCTNCQALYDTYILQVGVPITIEYMNIINTTGSSYAIYSTDSIVEATLKSCVFVYPQSVILTSFTATSSIWAAFVDCSFSFTPTSSQLNGNSISGSVKYNASACDGIIASVSSNLSCFLWAQTNGFTSAPLGQSSKSPGAIVYGIWALEFFI